MVQFFEVKYALLRRPKMASSKKLEVKIVDHPMIRHKLGIMRNKNTQSIEFRNVLSEISYFLAYECTRNLTLRSMEIETPLEKTTVEHIDHEIVTISILRAGEGMLDGFIRALPFARIGHIGIYRDKKMNNTIEYYFKLPPNVKGKEIFLIDPLLATGDTALAALDRLKEYEVGPIHFVSILAAPIGIEKIQEAHPDVQIVTAAVERELDGDGYLRPGVGDAGDCLFGTI